MTALKETSAITETTVSELFQSTSRTSTSNKALGTKITIHLRMFVRPRAWPLALQLVGVFVEQHSKRVLVKSEHLILKMSNRIFLTCAKVIPSQSCWAVQSQSCVMSLFLFSAGKVELNCHPTFHFSCFCKPSRHFWLPDEPQNLCSRRQKTGQELRRESEGCLCGWLIPWMVKTCRELMEDA